MLVYEKEGLCGFVYDKYVENTYNSINKILKKKYGRKYYNKKKKKVYIIHFFYERSTVND